MKKLRSPLLAVFLAIVLCLTGFSPLTVTAAEDAADEGVLELEAPDDESADSEEEDQEEKQTPASDAEEAQEEKQTSASDAEEDQEEKQTSASDAEEDLEEGQTPASDETEWAYAPDAPGMDNAADGDGAVSGIENGEISAAEEITGQTGAKAGVEKAPAAATLFSGTCGNNVSWTLDGDGVLVVSGQGPMDDAADMAMNEKEWTKDIDLSAIKSIVIEDGVTRIGAYFFEDVAADTVSIGNDVTEIGAGAFYSCTNLQEVSIPDSVTSIEDYAFRYTENLKKVTFGTGVSSIGEEAFSYSAIENVDLPQALTSLGNRAFHNCKHLKKVTVPNTVSRITLDESSFEAPFYESPIQTVEIQVGLTEIPDRFFYGADISELYLPSSVTKIGESSLPDWRQYDEEYHPLQPVIYYEGGRDDFLHIERSYYSLGEFYFEGDSTYYYYTSDSYINDDGNIIDTSHYEDDLEMQDGTVYVMVKCGQQMPSGSSDEPPQDGPELRMRVTDSGLEFSWDADENAVQYDLQDLEPGAKVWNYCYQKAITDSHVIVSKDDNYLGDTGNSVTCISLHGGVYSFRLKVTYQNGEEHISKALTYDSLQYPIDLIYLDNAPDEVGIRCTWALPVGMFTDEKRLPEYFELLRKEKGSDLYVSLALVPGRDYRYLTDSFGNMTDNGTIYCWDYIDTHVEKKKSYTYAVRTYHDGMYSSYDLSEETYAWTDSADYFIIGRDSNNFPHSDSAFLGEDAEGEIGTAYPTSAYYYAKLLSRLSWSEEIELLDRMNSDQGWQGSCEGLAISMGLSYMHLLDLSSFRSQNGGTPSCYDDLMAPNRDIPLRDLINYYQLLQDAGKKYEQGGTVTNLGHKIPFLDGRLTMSASKEDFFKSFVSDAKEAAAGRIPLLFSMGYSHGDDPSGHTILTCGYRETDQYHIIRLYDCNYSSPVYYDDNGTDHYLFLFVDKSSWNFWISTSGDSVEEYGDYVTNSNWRYFKYSTVDVWKAFETDTDPVAAAASASVAEEAGAAAAEEEAGVAASAGEAEGEVRTAAFSVDTERRFRLENGAGDYLAFTGDRFEGTIEILNLEILGDYRQFRITIPYSSDYRITDLDEGTSFSMRTDDSYVSGNAYGADRIDINDRGVSLSGESVSYNLRISMNTGVSLLEVSGRGGDSTSIVREEDAIKVVSEAADGIDITIFDSEGNVVSDHLDGNEAIEIREEDYLSTPLDDAEVSVVDQAVYTGSEIMPDVQVIVKGKRLRQNIDYRVRYSDHVNAGTAKIIITALGAYTGSTERTFEIVPASITPTVTLSQNAFVYNAKIQKPGLTVRSGGTVLGSADYDILWPAGSVNAGTYKVTVKLKGNYKGSGTASYTILKAPNYVTASADSFFRSYSAKAQSFSVGAKAKGGQLTYLSSNSGIKVAGDGTLTITGKYAGTAVVKVIAGSSNYETAVKMITVVVPASTKPAKLRSTSARRMTVKWKKNADASGYQIQYSLKRNFKGGKTVTITGNRKTSRKISRLVRGRKYYVRIRCFRTAGGKKYYSAWSAKKTVKVR